MIEKTGRKPFLILLLIFLMLFSPVLAMKEDFQDYGAAPFYSSPMNYLSLKTGTYPETVGLYYRGAPYYVYTDYVNLYDVATSFDYYAFSLSDTAGTVTSSANWYFRYLNNAHGLLWESPNLADAVGWTNRTYESFRDPTTGSVYIYSDGVLNMTGVGVLPTTPYYLEIRMYTGSSQNVYGRFDNIIIGEVPSSRLAVTTIPSNWTVIKDLVNPSLSGLYQTPYGSSTPVLVRTTKMWSYYSTGKNTSSFRKFELRNFNTGTVYETLYVSNYSKEVGTNLSFLISPTATAPTGLYAVTLDGSGDFGYFWFTANGATVGWDKAIYNLEESAIITWSISAGYYDVATYDYSLVVQDIYGTQISTTSIGQAGSKTVAITEPDYQGGLPYYASVKATAKSGGAVYDLGYGGMTVSDYITLIGYVMDATTGMVIQNANVSVNQSGATYSTKTTTTGSFNVTGMVQDFEMDINTSTSGSYILERNKWTPLAVKSYSVNISLIPSNYYSPFGAVINGIIKSKPYFSVLPDTSVTCTNSTDIPHINVTPITGYYECKNVTSGKYYQIFPQKQGYTNDLIGWVQAP